MSNLRPRVLTIAGFDPSSGAGLTADVKTFEKNKVYGLAVNTANTIQNDREFIKVHWVDFKEIQEQIDQLFNRWDIKYAKIGLVKNWEALRDIVDYLLVKNPEIKVVVDPIFKSSSSFSFDRSNENHFENILAKVHLVTPNYEEFELLFNESDFEEKIRRICTHTNLLLKGGHRVEKKGRDELYCKYDFANENQKQYAFAPKSKDVSEKHGTGCILSAAIVANLAKGYNLMQSCYRAKQYTEKAMQSNKSLLAYHY